MTFNTVLLTLLDAATDSDAISWMHEGEIRTWLGMIFWPLTVLFALVQMLVEKSGTGARR